MQSREDRFKDIKGKSGTWVNDRSSKDFRAYKDTYCIAISDWTNIHILDNCKM